MLRKYSKTVANFNQENKSMEFSTTPASDNLQFLSSLNSDLLSPIENESSLNSTSITFIDSGISDYETLIAGMEDTQIHILDSSQDAITQITNTLTGSTGIESLHILSHGNSGILDFAGNDLTDANLNSYSNQIESWGEALATDADILFYGCNLAATDIGKQFVNQIGNLTQADVAASDDLTGNVHQGGDWDLEFNTGSIETEVIVQDWAQNAYQDVLETFIVDSIADVVDSNDGVTTLREAIDSANAIAGFDSIVFDSSLFSSEQTIGLNLGQLNITDSLSINAPEFVTVSGNKASRVFEIAAGATVNLSGLIIADGKVIDDNGGGIKSSGNLTLENTIVRNNFAEDGSGGGIYNTGENLTVINSAIIDNTTFSLGSSFGGGIYNTGDNLTVNNSSVDNNTASGAFGTSNGGGIYNTGENLIVNDSNITSNQATEGGGIYSANTTLTIHNSNISSNSAIGSRGGSRSGGGGISASGIITISNSTISDNLLTSPRSGDAFGAGIDASGNLTINNSTITRNTLRGGTAFPNNDAYGGGIYTSGTAILNNTTISDNFVSINTFYLNFAGGGGIYSTGNLTLNQSTIRNNTANQLGNGISDGGGILNNGTLTINKTGIIDNQVIQEGTGISRGGGISNNGTVTINASAISNNKAIQEGENLSSGGGISNNGTQSILNVNASSISGNEASEGGGIANGDSGSPIRLISDRISSGGTVNVNNSNISDNKAEQQGAGIVNFDKGNVTVTRSNFNNNSARDGGAIANNPQGNVTVTDSSLTNNTASNIGGAIFNSSILNISRSNLQNNFASVSGGAIWNVGTLDLSNSSVDDNQATFEGGGIVNFADGTATITSSAVRNNKANNGGGIFNSGFLTLLSSYLAFNQANNGDNLFNAADGIVETINTTIAGS